MEVTSFELWPWRWMDGTVTNYVSSSLINRQVVRDGLNSSIHGTANEWNEDILRNERKGREVGIRSQDQQLYNL